MARRQILSLSDRESLLALPEDELTLTRMAYFSGHDLALISAHRKPASRFGFAVLLCYLKNVGFAPDKNHPHPQNYSKSSVPDLNFQQSSGRNIFPVVIPPGVSTWGNCIGIWS